MKRNNNDNPVKCPSLTQRNKLIKLPWPSSHFVFKVEITDFLDTNVVFYKYTYCN